jgi:4-amino-4-deoxy-L-arabinose transferase-like glycosyltransferase
MDVLWLYAFALGRHSAAALTHCVFLLALPLLMICYGKRNGASGPATAAALMVFAAPVVAIDGASAYIDVAVAFVMFAAFYAADALREEPSARSAALLGILAGGSFAAKYTAFIAFPLLLVILCAALWRTRGPAVKPLAVYSAWSAALWWANSPAAKTAAAVRSHPAVHRLQQASEAAAASKGRSPSAAATGSTCMGWRANTAMAMAAARTGSRRE